MDFSEAQQKVSKLLLKGPMTVDELRKESNLQANDINEALKNLIKMKLVERSDEKYKLIEYVTKGTLGVNAPTGEEKYKFHLIIEAISKDKDSLIKQCEILEKKFKDEKNISIFKFEKAEPQQTEELWSSYFNTIIGTMYFKDIISIIINYGPSSIEMLEPDRLNLSLQETHDSLTELSSAVHYYISFILGLQQKLMELKHELQEKTSSEKEQPPS
jgi:DNA-binding MarR family transcriptional regulator